jgi:hypothetical protein
MGVVLDEVGLACAKILPSVSAPDPWRGEQSIIFAGSPKPPIVMRKAWAKDRIVRERGYETLTRVREDVAEVDYQPVACQRTYRLILVRQAIAVEKGQARLFDKIRYRLYLTNDRQAAPRALVFKANDRCDQENLIAQLKGECMHCGRRWTTW